MDTFPFPVGAQDLFLCPTTPQDLAKSICMILTMGSSPSFFLPSLAVQFLPWHGTHFICLWLNKKTFPRSCHHYPKQHTLWQQCTAQARLGSHPCSIHFNSTRYTKTDPLSRQTGQYTFDNNQTVTHENKLVRCSPHAPGLSRNNPQSTKWASKITTSLSPPTITHSN